MEKLLQDEEVRKIEIELDTSFLRALRLEGIWKPVLREAALEVTEELLTGHGTAAGDARVSLSSYFNNIINGCNILLRHIEKVGVDLRVKHPDDLDGRVRRALGACEIYSSVEDAFVSYSRGYAKADSPTERVIRMRPIGTGLDSRLRYFNTREPSTKRIGEVPVQPLKLPDLTRGTHAERFARAITKSELKQQGGLMYEMEQGLINDFAESYYRFIASSIPLEASTSLGPITFEKLMKGYAALCALAYLHKSVSILSTPEGWDRSINWPALIRPRSAWSAFLEGYCGAGTAPILIDLLIFDPSRFDADLSITPLVALDQEDLGIAPTAVLMSNLPRNILVLLTKRFPNVYSAYSSGKENLLIKAIREELGPALLGTNIGLPRWKGRDLPDIDVLLQGPKNSIFVCEVKWQLEPSTTREVIYRDDYLKKGVRQLIAIRDFLREKPDFLAKTGVLSEAVPVEQLEFTLLCKGHLATESVHHKDVLITDFDFFVHAVKEQGPANAINSAKCFTYLPEEGVDFSLEPINVRFEDWGLSWLTLIPAILPADDEKSIVLGYYDDALEFLS